MKDKQLVLLIGIPFALTAIGCGALFLPDLLHNDSLQSAMGTLSYALLTLAIASPIVYYGFEGTAEEPKVTASWAINTIAAYLFCGGALFFTISASGEIISEFALSMGIQLLTIFVPVAAAVFAGLTFWKIKHPPKAKKPVLNPRIKGKKK